MGIKLNHLLGLSVVSRHLSHLVPSRFSCPVPWFPDRDWVRRKWKGRKSLNLCIKCYVMLWLKVPANVKKLKKLELKSQFWELFVALSKLFFTILSCELSFALSRIPSQPVSVFRTESRFVPSRQKPVSTPHYLKLIYVCCFAKLQDIILSKNIIPTWYHIKIQVFTGTKTALNGPECDPPPLS